MMWPWGVAEETEVEGGAAGEQKSTAGQFPSRSWLSTDRVERDQSSTRELSELERRIEASDVDWLAEELAAERLLHTHQLECQPLVVYAAARGLDRVAFEVARRCSPEELNALDGEGQTALSWAARDGRTALVIGLLSLGADYAMPTANALALAKDNENEETFHFLVKYHLAATEEKRKLLIEEHLKQAVYDMEVRHRVLRDDGDWIEDELSAGRLSVEYLMTKDESLLCYSVAHDKSTLVHPLLKFGADPNDVNDFGVSVLYFAAENQDFESFRLLLLYGAHYSSYEEAGYDSPEFACMEHENETLPAYAAAWIKMSEEERIAERAEYAPEFGEKAAVELERLEAMSRDELYTMIAQLQASEKEYTDLKRTLTRKGKSQTGSR